MRGGDKQQVKQKGQLFIKPAPSPGIEKKEQHEVGKRRKFNECLEELG